MKWKFDPTPKAWGELEALARDAVGKAPGEIGRWRGLAQVLAAEGKHPEAVEVLTHALDLFPGEASLMVLLARSLDSLGRHEEALKQAAIAAELRPSDKAIRLLKFRLLVKTNSYDEAGKLASLVAKTNPCDKYLFDLLASRSTTLEQHSKLLEFGKATILREPACTEANYYVAVTYAKLGDAKSARSMISLEELVDVQDLSAPPEFPDLDRFHQALVKEILAHPTLVADPPGKATRGGRQTGALRSSDGAACKAMLQVIRAKVEEYLAGADYKTQRFYEYAPKVARLDVWAVVYGRSTYQEPHHHASGWLSGVYYVLGSRSAAGDFRGSLLLGTLPSSDAVAPPWGVRAVQPVPGRLVMFPSYVPHSTEPTDADEGRISIAFDVVPVA